MLVIHKHYKAVCTNGDTVCLSADMGGVTEPVIFSLLVYHPVFRIIGGFPCKITEGFFVAFLHIHPVGRMNLAYPALPGIWEIDM